MSEFVDSLHDVFTRFGTISTRRMFGGHGVYHEGLMFALVADDCIYLKVDKETSEHFEARHLEPFYYDRKGKAIKMSYRAAPEEIFEDPDIAEVWAKRAYQAAVRSKK